MEPSKYFVGERLTDALRVFSDKCWKRAALIIGAALAGYDTVPRPEDLSVSLPENLRKSVVESLGDALGKCEIDNYLLVGDKIQPLIMNLVLNNTRVLTEAFIDKYNEAINEVRRVLNIARDRGVIYVAERLYWLGLASIIAKAVESGKPVEPGDADAVLDFALSAIQYVASPNLIIPILRALRPLRNKAPQRYLKLLASASGIGNLDLGTVRYILGELNEVLDNYGDVVRGYAWSLVHAIRAYANLLREYLIYISDEVEGAVRRVTNLLNELGRFKTSLGVIAWAYALGPALEHGIVRRPMEEKLGIDVVDKASEVAEELSRLRKKVKELIRDEEFMGYVESLFIKTDERRTDEETVKKEILGASSHLKHALALYRLNNDELKEAASLFIEAAEESMETGDYESYLINRSWVLRARAIKGSLWVDEFRWLYEKALNARRYRYVSEARYLSTASFILGNYLVSLALTGDDKTISELLKIHWWVLNADKQVSIPTRLMLNVLLSPRGRLSGELEGKLSVNPEELIETLNYYGVGPEFLPALRVAFRITKPEDGFTMCMLINDSIKGKTCMYAISVAMNDNAAVVQLRGQLIDTFRGLLFEKLGLLKELGVDADKLIDEFKGLADGLDGKSLAQLLAPGNSMAQFVLMLHALVNGNEKLAKALALMGVAYATDKLFTRLFLEAYKACCDLGSESFRRAIAKLFFYHV
jgi:HEPN domain-containing protein